MSILETGFVIAVISIIVYKAITTKSLRLEREKHIRQCTFSSEIFSKVKDKYPSLEEKDFYLVARALRQYFLVYLRARPKTIGMPSKVVDEMWHEFILDTRKYTVFCKKAFGGYFHHIPASKSHKGESIANGMKLTFRLACLEENINPNKPTRLPLLFAIDEKLKIPNSNTYKLAQVAHSEAANGSGCGGVACGGSSGSDTSSSCCGDGGCSGGCGGGCGGGGD